MKNWYRVQARGNAAEILIYDEIGLFGISAKNFIADLKALESMNVAEITLGINSPGGECFDGIAIYNALKRYPAKITGRVDGVAASVASVILMAADKIVMPDNSMQMIHNPWGGAIGDAEDMRDFADALDKIKIAILAAYRRTGKSDEELSAIMDAETWMTAEEAKAAGFADEVIQSVDIAALFDLGKYQKAPDRLRAKPAPAPELNNMRPQEEAAQYTSRVLSLCTAAGVPDLAPQLIEKKMSIADVEQRLAEAPSIRAICAAAQGLGVENAERRARSYIMAGVTKDEARHNLMEVLQAIQGPELDNKHVGDLVGGGAPSKRLDTLRIVDIYARRNGRQHDRTDELARKLAKVITEHGTLR